MIPLRKLKPLPVPNWNTREYNAKASQGYAWAENTIDGLAPKILIPPDWVQVDYPQEKDEQGFTPVVAFYHEPTQSAVGLRYTRTASPINPADFIDALDPRKFSHGISYRFDETLVAERLGKKDDGKSIWASAHRCGEHLFHLTGQGILPDSNIRSVARTFNSSLRFEAPPDSQQFERESIASDLGLELTVGNYTQVESAKGYLRGKRNPPEGAAEQGFDFKVEITTPQALPKLMLQTQQALNKIHGQPIVSSMQTADFPEKETQFLGKAKLRNFSTNEGREITLLSGSFNLETAIFISASYPSLSTNNLAWLASRFELSAIVQSLRLTETE